MFSAVLLDISQYVLEVLAISGVCKCCGCSPEDCIGAIFLGLIRVERDIKMNIYFRLHCYNSLQMIGRIVMRRLNYSFRMETRLLINRTISDQTAIAECNFKGLITRMSLLIFTSTIA